MNLIGLSILGLLLAVGFHQWNQWRMKSFQIDYSNVPGKVFVVTGANSGLGYETSKELLRHGGTVIMACRNTIRGEAARANLVLEITANLSGTERNAKLDDLEKRCKVVPLDLSSFDSVRRFPSRLDDASVFQIDVLINNAGIMAIPERTLTVDGLETQIGTNHFGHFLLTMLLYPRIVNDGRIVIHTGAIHLLHDAKFPFENIQSEKHYDPWTVYCNSKLANLLFTTALRRRIEHQESNKIVHVLAVHPGYSSTNLQANRFPLWELVNDLLAMSSVEGALSQIFGAVDPSVVSLLSDPAQYIGPEWVLFGRPHVQWPLSSVAWSVDAQEYLWNESVRMTGVDFPASRP